MKEKHIRRIVTGTGALAILILILYLPILIWSPPWEDFGYYINNNRDPSRFSACYFKNGNFFIVAVNGNDTAVHSANTFTEKPGHWMMKERNYTNQYDQIIKIFLENNIKLVYSVEILSDERSLYKDNGTWMKSQNPFIIWYVILLEWSN